MKKVMIIGAGPAGISAALYTVRAGIDTTVLYHSLGNLEKAHAIENYYGVPGGLSGKELALSGIEQAKALGVKFIEEEVVSISFEEKFVIETTIGRYEADKVVMATGTGRKVPASLKVQEYEGRGVSYCAICDAFFYRGSKVAVMGNGEFALHEIRDLQPVAAEITLLTNGRELEMEVPEGIKIETRKVKSLDGSDFLEGVTFQDGEKLAIDGLFIAYGTAGGDALARKIGASVNDGRVQINENMETSIAGLYAVGDCVGGLLQVAKAVYEGAVAGNHIAKTINKK